jgi:hypothetical protein
MTASFSTLQATPTLCSARLACKRELAADPATHRWSCPVQYVPYARDVCTDQVTSDCPVIRNLAWYQQNFPQFVLYKCDRKTPAWLVLAKPKLKTHKHLVLPSDGGVENKKLKNKIIKIKQGG